MFVTRCLPIGFPFWCCFFLFFWYFMSLIADWWKVRREPHILFHFHCSSSSSTFFSAFSFLSWSWSLSPHFKIGFIVRPNSDLWTLISMLQLHWISFLTLLCFLRSRVVKEELRHIEYPCWPSDQAYTDPKSLEAGHLSWICRRKKMCNKNRL